MRIKLRIVLIALVTACVRLPTGVARAEGAIKPDNICGAIALACAARASGADIDLESLLQQLPLNGKMMSFADLADAASRLGLASKAVRWRQDQRPTVTIPCIVRLAPGNSRERPHFVTLIAARAGAVRLVDPPEPAVWIPENELLKSWDGIALYVSHDPLEISRIATSHGWLQLVWRILFISGIGWVLAGTCKWFLVAVRHQLNQGLTRSVSPRHLMLSGWIILTWGIVISTDSLAWFREEREEVVLVDQQDLKMRISQQELIQSDGRAKCTFVLRNQMNQSVRIASVIPDCSCADISIQPGSVIPPGGQCSIQVRVKVGNQSRQKVAVSVHLADAIPEQISLSLEVTSL